MSTTTDRLPPNNPNAEQGLLGCCIWDGQNVAKAFDSGIQPEAFFDLRNRDIWKHLREMDASGEKIDLPGLTQFIVQKGAIELVGGAPYVSGCLEQMTAASNIDYHVKLVMEKWALRRILAAAIDVCTSVYEPSAEPQKIIGKLEQQIEEAKLTETATIVTAKEATLQFIGAFEAGQDRRRAGQELSGIPTGFRKLDRHSSGLPIGGLTIIGARPSVGKTAMLCNIVHHACVIQGVKTVVFSLETTVEKLYVRLASNYCDISATKLRDFDDLTEQEMRRMTVFAGKYANSQLVFSKSAFNCDSICSMIARHADAGFKLFLVDYLQIVSTTNRGRNEPRTYSVGSVATALKQSAIKHNVCIVALAQLKRSDDEENPPTPNDIADSDQLFRDADLMWLLHRKDKLNKPMEGSVLVAKNKDGETGFVPMNYTPWLLRWEERKENPHEN